MTTNLQKLKDDRLSITLLVIKLYNFLPIVLG